MCEFHSSSSYIAILRVTAGYVVAMDQLRSVEIRGPEVILTFRDSNSMRIPKKDVFTTFLLAVGLE